MGDLLERWELAHLSDLATLLTSEIVTNAVRHAESSPKLTVGVADGLLEVGVTDAAREQAPVMSDLVDSAAEGGRGLAIVDELSDGWGTNVLPDGKEVWFLLDTGDWDHRTSCVCFGEDLGRLVLDTGRLVTAGAEPSDDFDFMPG